MLRRLKDAELAMTGAQKALGEIDAALADPALFARDPERAVRLAADREAQAGVLEVAESAWLEASSAMEG